MSSSPPILAVCFDWGGTLMSEQGPDDTPMGLWPAITVIDGARECLASLHGEFVLAVATNATVSRRPMIERALARGGLLSYFTQIFCFTELGFRKHQIEFWRAVESGLGIGLESVAMIGDSLEHDVIAPARFGVRTVWFDDAGHEPPPQGVRSVSDLRQFAVLVRQGMR